MEHYKAALPYRDMIVGIGLDSNEYKRPPSLFEEVFSLARLDGFRITMHCDVGQDNTHEHIRQVASVVGGTGTDRIDHGLNAADEQELMDLILERDIGMTLCPWAYMRYQTYDELGPKMRVLFDAGIRITINSDDPPYMDNSWILHNMLLTKHFGFSDKEITTLARNAVSISWAAQSVKNKILQEIDAVYDRFYGSRLPHEVLLAPC
jgi:adenosine deaminase